MVDSKKSFDQRGTSKASDEEIKVIYVSLDGCVGNHGSNDVFSAMNINFKKILISISFPLASILATLYPISEVLALDS